jgi:protein-S-isoprenylcysteine O-methyltransferase Ste14
MLIAALILICVGVLFRWIAIRTLGKDFHLIIQVPSRVVKTGIYKYLKHPGYWGTILIIVGASLISAPLGIFIMAWCFFKSRMVIEEEIIKRCKNG